MWTLTKWLLLSPKWQILHDFSWRAVKALSSHMSSLSWICLNPLFKWMKCIMLPEGYSIFYNKYSSACIVNLSCMTDELQLRKWMGSSLRQMSPSSAILTDKLQLDLNKVSDFMLSNWCLIQLRQPAPALYIRVLIPNLLHRVLAGSTREQSTICAQWSYYCSTIMLNTLAQVVMQFGQFKIWAASFIVDRGTQRYNSLGKQIATMP